MSNDQRMIYDEKKSCLKKMFPSYYLLNLSNDGATIFILSWERLPQQVYFSEI